MSGWKFMGVKKECSKKRGERLKLYGNGETYVDMGDFWRFSVDFWQECWNISVKCKMLKICLKCKYGRFTQGGLKWLNEDAKLVYMRQWSPVLKME